MKVVYSDLHAAHAPKKELAGGYFTENFEKPSRAEIVLSAIKAEGIGPVLSPDPINMNAILSVHDPAYVAFLQSAHKEWVSGGFEGNAFASAFNVQHPGFTAPTCIEGKLGYYTGDGTVPLTETSWTAIEASASTAFTAQKLLLSNEDTSIFALCRPPGHHASKAAASGYCFLNNAAIAAQALIDTGIKKISLLDIDYHHGNGTQAIFYDRNDIQFLSIHADPANEYPYFLGYAAEKGVGKGEGFTLNYPLPQGIDFSLYQDVLAEALNKVRDYGPEVLIISLGVDTFKNDPISGFLLESMDYLHIGSAIASLKKPTLFVMEGGYAVEEIGVNVANVLRGFLDNR